MRKIVVVGALLLGGCASMERPQVNVIPAKPKPAVVSPIVTPNDQVKHRWYDRFKKHPRWFH